GILLGNSNGTFSKQSTLSTGPNSHPYSLAVGYLNEDTVLDIAVTNHGDQNVGVLLGNGDGTFRKQMTYSLGAASPYSVGISDLNNDNRMDLITTNNGTNNIIVLLGSGNGSFGNLIPYATGSYSTIFVAVGNFNRDNRLDIAVINNDTESISILLGIDGVSFENQTKYSTDSYPQYVAIGDFNNDTRLDIVAANSDGNTVTGSSPYSIIVGHLNNDTQLDIVVTNYNDHTVSVLLGYDTHLDIALTNTGDGTVSLLLGYGNGFFSAQRAYSISFFSYSLAAGDFNNDSRLDIVAANYADNSISVLLAYDIGALGNEISFAAADGSLLRGVVVSDVNNDTLLDVIVANYGTNTIGVFLGHDNSTFENQRKFSMGFNAHPDTIAIGDFNKDGQMDIAVANHGTKNIALLLGNRNGMFQTQDSLDNNYELPPLF
ncbi:unnamed protein product, partial [Rotaria magnacalcarata]